MSSSAFALGRACTGKCGREERKKGKVNKGSVRIDCKLDLLVNFGKSEAIGWLCVGSPFLLFRCVLF